MKEPEKPLVHKSCLLEKFPGKGGWTYAAVPEILPSKNRPFGWVNVRGSIDGYLLKKYKLMPMGEGRLFLPVRAEIRKKIGKQVGDYVEISLFSDEAPTELSQELIDCFENEIPAVRQAFDNLSETKKNRFLDRIYCAKTEADKVERIVEMMGSIGATIIKEIKVSLHFFCINIYF